MCLWDTGSKRAKRATLTLRKAGRQTHYKVYCRRNGRLGPLYYQGDVGPGIIKSNRRNKVLLKGEASKQTVERGIHTFCNRRGAKNDARWHQLLASDGTNYVVVPVRVDAAHLVAFGRQQDHPGAVFTRVTLSQKAYDKAMAKGDSP